MMKNLQCMKMQLLYCLLSGICFSSYAQTGTEYSITGDVREINVSISKVYIIVENMNGKLVMDSCIVKNGVYIFKGNIPSPSMVYMHAKYMPDARISRMDDTLRKFKSRVNAGTIPMIPLDFLNRYNEEYKKFSYSIFISATNMKVTSVGEFSNIHVTGAPLNADCEIFHKQIIDFQKLNLAATTDSMLFYSQLNDTANYYRVLQQRDKINAFSWAEVSLKFAQDHPTSPMSVLALSYVSNNPFNADLVKPTFDEFSPELKSSVNGKIFAAKIEAFYRTAIGQQAIDFTMKDTAGKAIQLSTFKGNYVLIDFWASWCAPCRKENKTLIKTWSRFKGKKLVILGVSLDYEGDRTKWMNAIHEDKLDWFQVSDLNGREGSVVKLYNVKGIPDNILIDPSGKIIARNIQGEALAEKLQELL